MQSGLTITGGELWAIGASGMAESPSESSTQAFVFTNLNGSSTGEVSIADSSGNAIATQTSSKQYSSVLYSGPCHLGGRHLRDPAGRQIGGHGPRQPVRDRHGFRPGRRAARRGSAKKPARQLTPVNTGSLMA